jgi:hypothetical protein
MSGTPDLTSTRSASARWNRPYADPISRLIRRAVRFARRTPSHRRTRLRRSTGLGRVRSVANTRQNAPGPRSVPPASHTGSVCSENLLGTGTVKSHAGPPPGHLERPPPDRNQAAPRRGHIDQRPFSAAAPTQGSTGATAPVYRAIAPPPTAGNSTVGLPLGSVSLGREATLPRCVGLPSATNRSARFRRGSRQKGCLHSN